MRTASARADLFCHPLDEVGPSSPGAKGVVVLSKMDAGPPLGAPGSGPASGRTEAELELGAPGYAETYHFPKLAWYFRTDIASSSLGAI